MLYMTKSDYEKILAHCKEGLPNESCGLIGGVREGDKKYIRKVYLLTNIDASNEHFSMDPREQLAAGYACKWIRASWQLSFPSRVSVQTFGGG